MVQCAIRSSFPSAQSLYLTIYRILAKSRHIAFPIRLRGRSPHLPSLLAELPIPLPHSCPLPASRVGRPRLWCVGHKPRLSGPVGHRPQTREPAARGAWATSPVYRGRWATGPKRPRPSLGVRGPQAPSIGAGGPQAPNVRARRSGCVGHKPRLSGPVGHRHQTREPAARGAWATSPVYRGRWATGTKRPRPSLGCVCLLPHRLRSVPLTLARCGSELVITGTQPQRAVRDRRRGQERPRARGGCVRSRRAGHMPCRAHHGPFGLKIFLVV
jgi:hypothetical protein